MSIAMWPALFAPCAIAAAAAWLLGRASLARMLADMPNERSLHETPTPRVGGLALLAGSMPFAFWLSGGVTSVALACALFLAVVSLADDLRSLPIAVRLAAHFAAAIVLVVSSPFEGPAQAAAVAAMVAIAAVVWSTNLFNFMDGADGLAGGMALIGFGTYAAVAHTMLPPLAGAAAAIASASAGFLLLNFPPARVFMGDAGSIPLGFLAAAFGWIGVTHDAWPAWFPLLVFSPFVADATVTLARRAWRREPVWRAHRSHHYQRLALAGWPRRRLALSCYALMVTAAASAVAALLAGGAWPYVIITAWTVTYATLFLAIDRRASSNGARERRPE